jgi:hypothetical protein
MNLIVQPDGNIDAIYAEEIDLARLGTTSSHGPNCAAGPRRCL